MRGVGDDVVYAGAGDDVVLGGAGADTLFGQDGSDRCSAASARIGSTPAAARTSSTRGSDDDTVFADGGGHNDPGGRRKRRRSAAIGRRHHCRGRRRQRPHPDGRRERPRVRRARPRLDRHRRAATTASKRADGRRDRVQLRPPGTTSVTADPIDMLSGCENVHTARPNRIEPAPWRATGLTVAVTGPTGRPGHRDRERAGALARGEAASSGWRAARSTRPSGAGEDGVPPGRRDRHGERARRSSRAPTWWSTSRSRSSTRATPRAS